jgi:hypothetical protein
MHRTSLHLFLRINISPWVLRHSYGWPQNTESTENLNSYVLPARMKRSASSPRTNMQLTWANRTFRGVETHPLPPRPRLEISLPNGMGATKEQLGKEAT